MWFACLSKTPRQPERLIGLTPPSCGSAASRFSVEGRAPCYRVRETSLRLRSTSECDPGYPHQINGACSLEVFCPFNATQPIRATAPGLSMPGSCCVLLLTMQFDALLPNRSPRCLSTGRVHGVQCPSELDLTEIILTSRSGFPLLRLANQSCACLIDRSQWATCLAGRQLIRAAFAAGLRRYARIR